MGTDMTADEISELFRRLREQMPDPRPELDAPNAFCFLVSVVLSAQATDRSVNEAAPSLYAVADTPAKMLELGESGLIPYIKKIGLYNAKARNIIALSRQLLERHGGRVPDSREELMALSGVGRKTANVVLNVVFKRPVMPVDTHVFRVCNRTALAPGKDVGEVEEGLEKVVPEEYALNAHHWLLLHGRYTCTARKPRCEVCVLAGLCRFKKPD
ncbi:MAG: endonuclease III [Treponema sp.]|nr:endonuclease III [Treponema sp.]